MNLQPGVRDPLRQHARTTDVVSHLIEGGRGLEDIVTDHSHAMTSVGWDALLALRPDVA